MGRIITNYSNLYWCGMHVTTKSEFQTFEMKTLRENQITLSGVLIYAIQLQMISKICHFSIGVLNWKLTAVTDIIFPQQYYWTCSRLCCDPGAMWTVLTWYKLCSMTAWIDKKRFEHPSPSRFESGSYRLRTMKGAVCRSLREPWARLHLQKSRMNKPIPLC